MSQSVSIFLVGHTGQVGGRLLQLLQRPGHAFKLVGFANRSGAQVALSGLDPQRTGDTDLRAALAVFASYAGPKIFIDASASEAVAAHYEGLLQRGIAVCTPNKLAFAGADARFDTLQNLSDRHGAPLHFEGTVGAALPVLSTVRNLRAAGDCLRSVEAVLSGTLAFVLDQLNSGLDFADAVELARVQGYTEPDPWADLSGADVARKLLILCRCAGIAIEPEAIELTPFAARTDSFAAHDAGFAARVAQARQAGSRLCYGARYADGRATVGFFTAPHPALLQGSGPDNVLVMHTDLYASNPLIIRGPGAGVALTASAVWADLQAASVQLIGNLSGWARAA